MSRQYVFKSFYAKESPFHKEYEYKQGQNAPTLRINPNITRELKNHFEESNMTWTDGMSLIIHDYLDRLCLQRQTFNHIEVIMLIPKTDDLDELNNKSKIIAYINTKTDFNEYYEHKGFDGEYNLVYELKPFDELNFPINLLRETKNSCLINTPKEDCESFERFKESQKKLYSDLEDDEGNDEGLDLDDCYFVRFPINNYLDIKKNGAYNHDFLRKDHLGLYVFHDPLIKVNDLNSERKILCFIDWHYLADVSRIEYDFEFHDGVGLINWIQNLYHDEDKDYFNQLSQAIYYAVGDDFTKLRLSLIEKDLLEKLEIVRSIQAQFSDD